ncbi:MAG: hypothetical protein IIT47_04260, partial [Oscillospiraceae bacterium]|nr:hypothetical protein [Oscillospiraceae bacterium]
VVVLALIACAVAAVCFLTNPEGGAKIEFSRGDILGAEAWHALTVETAGTRSLSGSELDELFERLQDLPRITRPGNHMGRTQMYTLQLDVTHADELVLRGYNTDGTMTEVVYRGKTWLVTDDDFSRYILRLCEAADTEQVIRWSADLDGDGETEYFVLDAPPLTRWAMRNAGWKRQTAAKPTIWFRSAPPMSAGARWRSRSWTAKRI